MENFSRERIALCLLVGGILLTCGYGASLAGVQRREVPFQGETAALGGLNVGLRAARKLVCANGNYMQLCMY